MQVRLSKIVPSKSNSINIYITLIITLAVFSYGRIYQLHDVFWDDNCWLLSVYASKNLTEFLNTGFLELRRILNGTILYFLFSLHKHSDFFYPLMHSLNIFIQVLTPLFLFIFFRNLFKNQIVPFFISVSFIIFALDYSLPYLTAINYRLSILLTVISFYFTQIALETDKPQFLWILLALILSLFSVYFLFEATFAYEIARLFVIGYSFHRRNLKRKILIKKTVLYWSPFIILSIPLILYKIIFKPYGIYEGTYKVDYFFILNFQEHIKILKILLGAQWKVFLSYIRETSLFTLGLSLSIIAVVFQLLNHLCTKGAGSNNNNNPRFNEHEYQRELHNVIIPSFITGFLLLLPQIVLLELTKREIGPGMNSSHFSLMQFGYSIILGSFLYILFIKCLRFNIRMKWLYFLGAIIIATGVFFNNLNIDIYMRSWEKQNQFWRLFVNKFPNLPETADFFMDVRNQDYYDASDLDNNYDLELNLNLLYTRSTKSEEFRRYRVYAMEEFLTHRDVKIGNNPGKIEFERYTHFGKEKLAPQNLIFIYYHNNEFLVNREIIERHPDVPYKMWANKPFPLLPSTSGIYPLRHKISGLSAS